MLGIEPATSAVVVNMLTPCGVRPFISKQETELCHKKTQGILKSRKEIQGPPPFDL